jgi:hypothetical protein
MDEEDHEAPKGVPPEEGKKKEEIASEPENKEAEEKLSKPEEHIHHIQTEEKSASKKMGDFTDKLRKNPFMLSTLVFGVLAVLLLVVVVSGGSITGNVVSKEKAGDNLVEYLSTVVDSEIILEGVEDTGALYEVTVNYQGNSIPIYVTKDGASYTSNLIPLVAETDTPSPTPTPSDVPKSDVPVVELFVMTHCPYGTQAEKGMLPVMELLKDVADINIRFVHYYMHTNNQEEVETPKQVCIREEQSEKYEEYLSCFLASSGGSVADSDACVVQTGIDQSALDSCVAGAADGYYEDDSALSEGYGVQGSPTLVINGQIVSSGRSPSAYLDAICQAFNNAPAECGETVSTDSPAAGFGTGTGAATDAQC